MRPLAFAITASVCDGGPITAIDFPGADPNVSAITTTSQPQATSAIAPAIRRSLSMRWSVIVKVLNTHTPGLEVAVDVHQTVDPSLHAGPAKAGLGIKLQ